MYEMMIVGILLIFILGFCLGYVYRGSKTIASPAKKIAIRPQILTHHQRLKLKSLHQSDSDRIRELNRLSSNQSAFLRLLKQTFFQHEIAVKNNRFIVLDRDHFPIAIFEYRDGHQPLKLVDEEDGLPLHLYKGLISSEELKKDHANIFEFNAMITTK